MATSTDRTLLVTGGSNGIGRKAVADLLRDHPELHLVILVRGAGRGEALQRALMVETGRSAVSTITCDLESLADIRSAAAEVVRQLDAGEIPPLGGYLGNAGMQVLDLSQVTVDGYQTTFAVNVLAHYLLVRLLADRFVVPARIVLVGSDTHFADYRNNLGFIPALNWSTTAAAAAPGVEGRAGIREVMRTYARSKLAVVYLVHALARRLPAGVDVFTYNPGPVPGTQLGRNASLGARALALILHALRFTPFVMGVDTAGKLMAATIAGPPAGPTGTYIDRGREIPSSPESYDVVREEELWTTAARLCGIPS